MQQRQINVTSASTAPHREPPAFVGSKSETARLIAAHDWSATLGPIDAWPASLKTVTAFLLHSPVPMVLLWGEDGIMIYNDAYSVFAGSRHPALLGSKVREGWPEVADFNDHVMKVGLAGGTLVYKDQELTLNRTGVPEPAWMNLDYSPVMDESGQPAGVIAIVVETTGRVLSERGLHQSQQRLRLALDSMAMGTFTWYPLEDRTEADARMMALFGLQPHEELSLKSALAERIHPDDGARYASAVGRALDPKGTGRLHAEIRVCVPGDIERWVSITGQVQFDTQREHPTSMVGTALDITESKLTNAALEARVAERTQELVDAQDALRQAQKMEAVGQLTGGIAHDFNNLLAGISGSLQLLERRFANGNTEDVQRYIDAAQGSTHRAAALTQRLLAFSRRQTLDPKPIDVNRLITGMEDLIRRSIGPTVELEVVGAGGLWTTRVDPSQLEISLLNLCINARDAMMPDGGRLTIETANKWLDDRGARERELPPGQYISLCVTDTGTGMTPEVIGRAFDPFFTTKPLGQGTGLGLSMVYGFVRQSGGQVRIYSEVGKGTTMCLYLPRYAGVVAQDDTTTTDTPSRGRGEGETVLVIDDEATIRMLIVDVLEENQYRALEAEDGRGALSILQSDARVDLLITDVGLPGGMNGRQIADAARVTRPNLKVLFITGYAENAVVGNGHLDVGMELITKPFNTVDLGNKIRELIDRPLA